MEDDEDVIPHLRCEIELDFVGPSDVVLNNWTAEALRNLADRIENNDFETGNYSVTDNSGKLVGTIDIDYYGEMA